MSLAVVDLKRLTSEDDDDLKKDEKTAEIATDPEDGLWAELMKTLEKLDAGMEGDISNLSRSIRTLNRFRLRFSDYTWSRIVYLLLPESYRQEFIDLLSQSHIGWETTKVELVSRLCGVSSEDASSALDKHSGEVMPSVLELVSDKEKLAATEIKKQKKELAEEQQRLEDELKKTRSSNAASFRSTNAPSAAHTGATSPSENVTSPSKDKKDDDVAMADGEKKAEKKPKEDRVNLIPLRDSKKTRKFYPETYVFLRLLIAFELFDHDKYEDSLKVVEHLISFTKDQNRRTSDLLAARVYQLYSLIHMKLNKLPSIRNRLFGLYQTACLQQNEPGQAVLITLILQNYVSSNLYSLAQKFAEKADFPESADSALYARYHYYRGRCDAVRLQYADALYHMQQAIRRAPQNGAVGFKVEATQWLVAVHLLMGDIPERALFTSMPNKAANEKLEPYFKITNAVREGLVRQFQEVLAQFESTFKGENIYFVLLRLRHNVIKTGLRKINKSYSKISLEDIASKLLLDTPEDAYYIVAKAIRDGVINATIDYNKKSVVSRQHFDVYSTDEPYKQFATRVRFCLDIHTTAVKALRYPPNEELEKKVDEMETRSPEDIAKLIQEAMEEDSD